MYNRQIYTSKYAAKLATRTQSETDKCICMFKILYRLVGCVIAQGVGISTILPIHTPKKGYSINLTNKTKYAQDVEHRLH